MFQKHDFSFYQISLNAPYLMLRCKRTVMQTNTWGQSFKWSLACVNKAILTFRPGSWLVHLGHVGCILAPD